MTQTEFVNEKLNAFLESRNLEEADLTAEELAGLRQDYAAEYNGITILDGWEHSISPYRCFEKKLKGDK